MTSNSYTIMNENNSLKTNMELKLFLNIEQINIFC